MRLTETQRRLIRAAGLRHFGVTPRLFGSRLDDDRRGGDIDLFIPGRWSAVEAVSRRLRFCAEVKARLGDQKIDVVVENPDAPSAIQDHAKRHSQPV
jgi:predicted nucleotidyltransferase